jgi:selenocysteine lyase/cysteine desulfurase
VNNPIGGRKTMLYADWTASGRALAPVEDYVRAEVLPMYANTHTTTSVSGLQSTCFRQEARQVIAQACNARVGYSDKHSDVVVFAGSGSTGAINKLALVLGVHLPLPAGVPPTAQPVIILGPHEHHSNILPWRESAAKVVHVPEGADGGIDRAALRDELRAHASHSLVIGSFSAASNVTGVVADVDGITEELHRAGALAFWDYAAAASYLTVDMNPVRFLSDGSLNPHVYKDAVFISPHKLPGGPGAPGVLVAKRSLFVNDVPTEPGGGTVFFVTGSDQRYISNRHEREEGGTQDIVVGPHDHSPTHVFFQAE